jgi:hydrogenase maturation protease
MGILPDPTVRIVVCGNAERGDDGAALVAVATLLPSLPRELLNKVEVRRCLELRAEDLADLPAAVSCLILDAVIGPEPGEVVALTLADLVDLVGPPDFTPRSWHERSPDLLLGFASVLRDRAVNGTFVGLAGHGFGYGTPLSRVVRAAIPVYRRRIEAELILLADLAPCSRSDRQGTPA